MIKAKSITLKWKEGDPGGLPLSFPSFSTANVCLQRLRVTAPPKGQGYDKTDFVVEFEDGETYEGRIDLQRDVYETLDGHIREFCEFHAGRTVRLPAHLTPAQYQRFLKYQDPADIKSLGEFLDKYQLGDN